MGSLDILAGRYEDCVELDTGLNVAYDNRGACYSAMGKYPEALEDLDKALILFPDRAETYGTRAGVHIWLKDYDAALSDARKAVKLKPELERALKPLIQMAEGNLKR